MITQILIELHGSPNNIVNDFFERMYKERYVVFHKEPNTSEFDGYAQDYAFLKLRDEFFDDD